MRVAILHDHLSFIGGGERTVMTLAKALAADVFVTDLDPELPVRMGFPDVRVGEIAKVPNTPILRQNRQAKAFSELELSEYDAYILSGNWAVFASKRHIPNIWYCHTPVRVFYDLRGQFLGDLSAPKRAIARRWIAKMQKRYESAVGSVQRIVANSRNVQGRIERYLHRKADVVNPPVKTSRYHFDRIGDFWLSVNRLSHEKRLGLQVESFRQLPGERLIVAGGPQVGVDAKRFVRSLQPPDNVQFLGEVEEGKLIDLYASCRGFIATSEDEDFGLTPIEAMASGKIVLAADEGGYRESVVHGETGWLLPAKPDAFADKIKSIKAEEIEAMKDKCIERAAQFDEGRFIERMKQQVLTVMERGGDRRNNRAHA